MGDLGLSSSPLGVRARALVVWMCMLGGKLGRVRGVAEVGTEIEGSGFAFAFAFAFAYRASERLLECVASEPAPGPALVLLFPCVARIPKSNDGLELALALVRTPLLAVVLTASRKLLCLTWLWRCGFWLCEAWRRASRFEDEGRFRWNPWVGVGASEGGSESGGDSGGEGDDSVDVDEDTGSDEVGPGVVVCDLDQVAVDG